MANSSIVQPEWGGGIWRGRKAPAGSVYDAVNALVDDEGNLFQRGAVTHYSDTDAGEALVNIAAVTLAGPEGQRVLAWGATGNLYVLDGTTPELAFNPANDFLGRPVGVGGVIVFPLAPVTTAGFRGNQALMYGGSLLPSGGSSNQGTITVTSGSVSVTKSGGTTWVGNVDPGMFLQVGGVSYGLVKSVDGANALTLVYPADAGASTGTYEIVPSIAFYVTGAPALPVDIPQVDRIYLGTAARRLLVGVNNRVYLAEVGFPFPFNANAYHELPAATRINGIQGVGETAYVFATAGIWAISNLSLDIVDDVGNVQQQVDQVSGDVILWGENGLATWGESLVVPALDDVYLMSPAGAFQPVSEAIRPLYRGHVSAGRTPGTAAVHRGHLHLPVLEGADVVDTLVCRLDRPFEMGSGRVFRPWTRLDGQASGPGYAVLHDEGAPSLLGLSGARVTDLTGIFDGTGPTDADGQSITFQFTSNDYPTGQGNQPGTVTKLRLRYELESNAISDRFDYSDGPLPSPWLPWSQTAKPNVAHGVAVHVVGEPICDATHPTALAANSWVEAFFGSALPMNGSYKMGLGIRLTAHDATADGYTLEISDTGGGFGGVLYKGASFTTIATGAYTFTDVDAMRLSAAGSSITGWLRCSGVWTQVVSATDTSYPDGGYVGIFTQSLATARGITEITANDADVGVAYSSDQDADVFTDIELGGGQDGTGRGEVATGSRYAWWPVGKRRERVRFRVTVEGAQSFLLRSLEALVRVSGRQ